MKKILLIFIFLLCGSLYIYGQTETVKRIEVSCKKIGENGKAIQDDGVYDFDIFVVEKNGKKNFCIISANKVYFFSEPQYKLQWKWLREEKLDNSLICSVGFWGAGKIYQGSEIQACHFQYKYEFFYSVIIQRILYMFEPSDINNPNFNYTAYEIISENGEEFDDFIVYLRQNIFDELK